MTVLKSFDPQKPGSAENGRSGTSVLTTWKEVARYMGKGVRTVQRWERDFSLPVRRPTGSRNRRAILALTSDLDAWVALSCSRQRHDQPADGCGDIASTLRDRLRIAEELRIANRLLINEIHIAMEALHQRLSAMCPPSPARSPGLSSDSRDCFPGLPN
jgi:predicted DNA-binding transcriptional regulator AlpA